MISMLASQQLKTESKVANRIAGDHNGRLTITVIGNKAATRLPLPQLFTLFTQSTRTKIYIV